MDKFYQILVIFYLICFCCEPNDGAWSAQCWKKHNSGSIQLPDGEFRRPFGILCSFQCYLWFPPMYNTCEFIFDLRLSRHFTNLDDCDVVRCNETFRMPWDTWSPYDP
ncbi:uncharacterized protein LOC129910115 [Episyrphus balteatus]|uniref:uncharacterized protein LOC129910115 n=1 Tax=Episyrphus balteatus TaxID=286459 RepID=UPI0024866C31|nr:uncharacterized protein LOC129910115 [Episyrphus balteatus]